MKKKICLCALALLFAFGLMPAKVQANQEITITVNGQQVIFEGQGPVIIDGRTLVPFRSTVFDMLGFDERAYISDIEFWYENIRQLVMWRDGRTVIEIPVSDARLFVVTHFGGDIASFYTRLDVSARIVDGVIMVPLRAIAEAIGAEVEWIAEQSAINILFDDVFKDPTERNMQEMNSQAELLREQGHQVVILEDYERIRFRVLFMQPGLAFGISQFRVNGEVVTAINPGLYWTVAEENLLEENIPRARYVRWVVHRGQGLAIAYVEVFDDEILLLEERFEGYLN